MRQGEMSLILPVAGTSPRNIIVPALKAGESLAGCKEKKPPLTKLA